MLQQNGLAKRLGLHARLNIQFEQNDST